MVAWNSKLSHGTSSRLERKTLHPGATKLTSEKPQHQTRGCKSALSPDLDLFTQELEALWEAFMVSARWRPAENPEARRPGKERGLPPGATPPRPSSPGELSHVPFPPTAPPGSGPGLRLTAASPARLLTSPVSTPPPGACRSSDRTPTSLPARSLWARPLSEHDVVTSLPRKASLRASTPAPRQQGPI